MPVRLLIRSVFAALLLLGLATVAMASAQDAYVRGVSAFKSLLASEKRSGLRAEWLAVMKPFEQSLAAAPKGEYAPKSLYFLGRSYEEMARRSFVKADRKAALDAFDRMLAGFPKHEWADDSLYRKGLIWQELAKDSSQAEKSFKAVIDTYPKGDMVPEARQRLAQMGDAGAPPASTGQGAGPKAQASAAAKPAVEAGSKQAAVGPKTASPAAATTKKGLTLLGIRHWSSQDYTRVVMDMTGDVKYERALVEKASNGNKHLQITLQQSDIAADVMPARIIKDGILSQIQVGADASGGVLVTFDLMQMDHYRVFTLPEPYRVVIDIYGPEKGKTQQTIAAAAMFPNAGTAPDTSTAASADADHVQVALAELQAKQTQESAKKEAPKKKDVKSPAPKATPAASKAPVGAATDPTESFEKAPEITVSPKQKKYTGSLVEQLGLKVRTIMIDAGHGGKDPGAVANGVQEKNVNLRMSKLLGRMLQDQGFDVHYTRTTDKFIPLEERTAMANAKNADLFISLHCNAYKDAGAKGLEVYYLNLATDAQAVRVAARENGVSAKKISDMQFILSDLMLNSKINESRQMAAHVEQETMRIMRPKYAISSHGSKGAFFYVLTGARMPSVLVELGYLTNPGEAANLTSDAYLSSLAKGLAGGVMAYKKKLERFAQNSSGKS